MSSPNAFNFNVGVLGHVDSGKTSLSKVLSTVASTASFDKNPQSKERGITLDLGFSSFSVSVPDDAKEKLGGFESIQYTLVDCPGHASLIRTVIGGAQIIDLMLLVIDIVKGMQTQTAECLLIGEITCRKMIVILNKLDLVPAEKQQQTVEKMKKRMWKTLEGGPFANCPIVAVAAKPGGPEAPEREAVGINELITTLQQNTFLPTRVDTGPFVFAVDHCFSIRGQGTVLTGTVLSGSVAINETVDIPAIGASKKIKSIQMFRKPIEKIKQGDRAGICVTQFDPKQVERGLVCSPGALVTAFAVIVSVQKVPYYKGIVSSKSKFHITLGHETVMGKLALFSTSHSGSSDKQEEGSNLSKNVEGLVLDSFDWSRDYEHLDELQNEKRGNEAHPSPLALIELDLPVICSSSSLVIGSRLDADIHSSSCRIAFHGKVLHILTDSKYREKSLPKLRVFKRKSREGLIERAPDKYSIICKNLFKKETNLASFANLKVELSTGEKGMIEGGFGQSGKVKIRIPEGLEEETFQRYSGTSKRKGKAAKEESEPNDTGDSVKESVKVILRFKRFIYDTNKTMIQS